MLDSFGAGIDFGRQILKYIDVDVYGRQNLTSKVDPRTDRVNNSAQFCCVDVTKENRIRLILFSLIMLMSHRTPPHYKYMFSTTRARHDYFYYKILILS